MGQAWYYTRGGQQTGPVEWSQLQQLAATGQLGGTELVWCEGMAQWSAAASIPGLMAAPAPTAQPYNAPLGYQNPAGLNYYTPQPQFAYAGFWLRFVASLLDGLICCVVVIPVLIGIVFAIGIDEYGQNVGMQYAIQGLFYILLWPYFALLESGSAQATFGKRALGIIVTDINGQRISFGQASGRYFGKLLSGFICYIGYMMAGWTQKKQALHDMMASTLVMRKS